MNTLFPDRLIERISQRKSAVAVGLDPTLECLPTELVSRLAHLKPEQALEVAASIVLEFSVRIIDAVADLVPAVKPQAAYYERLGPMGAETLSRVIRYAQQQGLLVILDAKRNDIQPTAQAYADAYIGATQVPFQPDAVTTFGADAITVSPYLGSDGIVPFIDTAALHGRGVFVLVKTSNPSATEFQDLMVSRGQAPARRLCDVVAERVNEWGASSLGGCGYSAVGAVVGATFPQDASKFREIMPHTLFLVPGMGAQGGNADTLSQFFDTRGLGAIVAASRSIIYAHRDQKYARHRFDEAARLATTTLCQEVERAREAATRKS